MLVFTEFREAINAEDTVGISSIKLSSFVYIPPDSILGRTTVLSTDPTRRHSN